MYLTALYDYLMKFKERGFDVPNEYGEKYQNHPMGGSRISFGAFNLSGLPKVAEWEKKYIPSEKLEKYDHSIGLYDPRAGEQRKT
jgi:hypothetical protein